MIVIATAWQMVRESALKAMMTDMVYKSLVEKRLYKVLGVEETKITLSRASGGEDAVLTKQAVEKAIQKFNRYGGDPMKRRTLIEKPVIKETTLLLFHPQLSWDETGDFIIEVK